jgi:hypothetical protein
MALLGVEAPGADATYDLARSNAVVTARRELGDGLRVVKEFQLQSNEVLRVTTRLQNWSDRSRVVPAQEWVFGTRAASWNRR